MALDPVADAVYERLSRMILQHTDATVDEMNTSLQSTLVDLERARQSQHDMALNMRTLQQQVDRLNTVHAKHVSTIATLESELKIIHNQAPRAHQLQRPHTPPPPPPPRQATTAAEATSGVDTSVINSNLHKTQQAIISSLEAQTAHQRDTIGRQERQIAIHVRQLKSYSETLVDHQTLLAQQQSETKVAQTVINRLVHDFDQQHAQQQQLLDQHRSATWSMQKRDTLFTKVRDELRRTLGEFQVLRTEHKQTLRDLEAMEATSASTARALLQSTAAKDRTHAMLNQVQGEHDDVKRANELLSKQLTDADRDIQRLQHQIQHERREQQEQAQRRQRQQQQQQQQQQQIQQGQHSAVGGGDVSVASLTSLSPDVVPVSVANELRHKCTMLDNQVAQMRLKLQERESETAHERHLRLAVEDGYRRLQREAQQMATQTNAAEGEVARRRHHAERLQSKLEQQVSVNHNVFSEKLRVLQEQLAEKDRHWKILENACTKANAELMSSKQTQHELQRQLKAALDANRGATFVNKCTRSKSRHVNKVVHDREQEIIQLQLAARSAQHKLSECRAQCADLQQQLHEEQTRTAARADTRGGTTTAQSLSPTTRSPRFSTTGLANNQQRHDATHKVQVQLLQEQVNAFKAAKHELEHQLFQHKAIIRRQEEEQRRITRAMTALGEAAAAANANGSGGKTKRSSNGEHDTSDHRKVLQLKRALAETTHQLNTFKHHSHHHNHREQSGGSDDASASSSPRAMLLRVASRPKPPLMPVLALPNNNQAAATARASHRKRATGGSLLTSKTPVAHAVSNAMNDFIDTLHAY